jgi:hypothetical protein
MTGETSWSAEGKSEGQRCKRFEKKYPRATHNFVQPRGVSSIASFFQPSMPAKQETSEVNASGSTKDADLPSTKYILREVAVVSYCNARY